MKKKRFIASLAMTMMGVSMAAQAESLKIGMSQYPEGLHPLLVSNVASSYILSTAIRSPIIYGKNWELVCNACETVPTFENGLAKRVTLPDGREGIQMSLTIPDDLYWDGTPVTTKDFQLGFEIERDERVGNPGLQEAKTIESIQVHNDKKFDVLLNKITFKYSSYIPAMLPAHLEGDIYKADPANYAKKSLYAIAPTTPGLYYGPYLIDKVRAGSFITAKPNPFWKGKQPKFDRLIFKTVENTAALEAHLLSGSVDYLPGELGLSLDQVLQLEKRHKDKFNVHYEPGLLYEHLDTTMENPHLAIKKVRQALLYGANRQQLVDQLFQGV